MVLIALTIPLMLVSGPARPIGVGSAYPAAHLCSRCGLCDTPLISAVASACAFLGDGMARIDSTEPRVHGRARNLDDEAELYFGVHSTLASARMVAPLDGAAWTGIVSSIAIAALEAKVVDAVIAVGAVSDQPFERMEPRPRLCRSADDVRACSGVKPVLSNSLRLLDEVRADPSIRRLLFIGVGCQVQALRAVQASLGLDELLVLGTNCADNVGTPAALRRFLEAVSSSPSSASGFEFMQDYSVCGGSADIRRSVARVRSGRALSPCPARLLHCRCTSSTRPPPALRPPTRSTSACRSSACRRPASRR
jgi:7-hydroxymethyl chlorophyll a reductase